MDRFTRGLRVGKEIVAISSLAVMDFFFHIGIFVVEGIMMILSLIFWLAILALFLMMSG